MTLETPLLRGLAISKICWRQIIQYQDLRVSRNKYRVQLALGSWAALSCFYLVHTGLHMVSETSGKKKCAMLCLTQFYPMLFNFKYMLTYPEHKFELKRIPLPFPMSLRLYSFVAMLLPSLFLIHNTSLYYGNQCISSYMLGYSNCYN